MTRPFNPIGLKAGAAVLVLGLAAGYASARMSDPARLRGPGRGRAGARRWTAPDSAGRGLPGPDSVAPGSG
jgi:hypothetical protein